MLCSASMYMIHIDTLCICYVYVMCMLFVCNMMLTLQRREISRKTKSPTSSERTLRRGHGRRAQRWKRHASNRRTLRSTAPTAPRNGPKDADLTALGRKEQTGHWLVADLSLAADGITSTMRKVTLQPFGYMLVHLIIFGADFRWLLMAFESDWMLFHIAPDPFKFVTFVLLLLLSLREIGNNVCLVGFFHQTGMSQASFIRWMIVQTASITSWLQAIRSWPQIVQW